MKRIKYILSVALLAFGVTACDDFGDINVDPNQMSNPETTHLLLGAEMRMPFFSINDTYNPWTQVNAGYFSEPRNYQFTRLIPSLLQFANGGLYTQPIHNCEKVIAMNREENNPRTGALGGGKNNQIAVAETLRAYYYMHITDATGMTPYFEAIKALEGKHAPKYDSMKDIYADLDKRLTEAYKMFDPGKKLNGRFEILYKGDIVKWKKLNASLRMMMAIKLSDVDPAAGKERFARAFADGGLEMDGAAVLGDGDTFAFPYLKENDNANLLYKNIILAGRRDFSPSHYVVDNFLALNDPRIVDYATPLSDGTYVGCPFGVKNEKSIPYSEFTQKYYQQDAAQEVISAAHIKLLQAEAALRGWITGSASKYYVEGIQQSFNNCGIGEGMVFPQLAPELLAKLKANVLVASYVAQPAVALTGDMASDLKKIAMQRWLNNYLKDGVEAWSDIRRLDWPVIEPGKDASDTKMPLRMAYHADDYDANRENYEEAIAIQPDKTTTRLWWDVK